MSRSSIEQQEIGSKRIARYAVDVGIVGVVFVAPLFMGGRHDVGRFVYVALVAWTAMAWMLLRCLSPKQPWRWSGAEWLLLAATVLVVLQLAPLPHSVLATLSPQIPQLLPLWGAAENSSSSLGMWSTISLTPGATQGGLAIFLAHAMLFLVVFQRLESKADIERLVRWVACAAMLMAALGLVQFLFGNGKFLWIYEHPSRGTADAVKGPFQNENHFAHLLALGVGPLIWWLASAWKDGTRRRFGTRSQRRDGHRSPRVVLSLGVAVVAVATLLTFSRGGIAVAAIAATVCLGVHLRCRLVDLKTFAWVGGPLVAILVAAVTIDGSDSLSKELRSLTDARSWNELCSERAALWRSHLKAIPSFLVSGTGVGSHREVYPLYLDEHFDVEFTHGENGYLQVLLETGLAGLSLVLCGVAWSLKRCLQCLAAKEANAELGLSAALFAAVAASLVHSLGDFVWYIPACMAWTLILLACLGRLSQLTTSSPCSDRAAKPTAVVPVRLTWLAVTAASSLFMIADRLPPARVALCWDDYFRVARQVKRDGQLDASADQVAAMAGSLDRLLRTSPTNARANLRMAGLCLRVFDIRQQASENPMGLAQIRDAALASQFPDLASQDRWLDRVLGENRRLLDKAYYHARLAARQCPLQGESYVYLAELAFLAGGSEKLSSGYIGQALRVRPHSGLVLISAGSEAALRGDSEQALRYWKRAFDEAPDMRGTIIGLLASQLGAKEFIRQFDPDREGLAQLYQFYRQAGQIEQSFIASVPYEAALQTETDRESQQVAAETWGTIARLNADRGDWARAAECAQLAVTLAPDDFGKRDLLARAFLESRQYEAAITQLRWCLGRKPGHRRIESQLETATRQQLLERESQAGPADEAVKRTGNFL